MGDYDYMIRRTPNILEIEHVTNKNAILLQLDDGIYKLKQSLRGWDVELIAKKVIHCTA